MGPLLTSIVALTLPPPAAAQDTPYPALEVLDAFRDGCGAIEDQAAASASLAAAGWEVSDPAVQPVDLTEFLAFARDAGGRAVTAQGGSMSDMEVFEKTIAGERLFVVLSEVKIDEVRVTGCRLFDFGETRAIPAATVTEWLDRESVNVIDRPEAQIADWEPGTLPGHDSFQLFFVPTDSPVKDAFKFDGIALKSDTVGVSE
ncbi:MAG: hypothetical protein AAF250_12245 [Pseudomonadota bacterium]